MMKQVLISVSLLAVASFARADFRSTNLDLCEGASCTTKMTEINKAFTDSVHFAAQAGGDSVYSGPCYHLSPYYDAEHEHHALAVFSKGRDEVLNYSGVFSFFAPQDPYRGMTVTDARAYAERSGSQAHATTLETTKGRVEVPYSGGKITYYFRTNESGSELYLLSRWVSEVGEQRAFCRLQKH